MARMPLHFQILIALVLGSIVGILVNPGEVALPDVTIRIVPNGTGPAGPSFLLEQVSDKTILWQEEFANAAALSKKYPSLAEASKTAESTGEPAAVKVTRRRAHIVEDGENITINYSRREDGKPAVSTIRLDATSPPFPSHPEWTGIYREYGGGTRATLTISAKRLGDLFLRLLKMITVPLIVTSLVTGVAGLGNTSRLGAMFSKTLAYYVVTSMLAITTGIVMVNIVRPGIGAELPGGGEPVELHGEQTLGSVFFEMINNMIPPNPVQSLAGGDFLSIITFSILLGVFIIRVGGESGQTLRNFFQAGFDVMMGMTLFIIRLAPIGVFAFMMYATASQGLDIFLTLAWYMLAVFLALAVHAAITLPLLVAFVGRRSPWQFFKAMSPALMTAVSTASSNGTLPLTISCVEDRARVSNRVSSFVLPLGATINMDGTALYEAVAVLFIAQATPGFAMTLQSQIVVAITALLASVGAAGIPHAGLVMMAIVLQAVGLPLEAQGVIIAVDRVLDMLRTGVNVWSDSCGCAVVHHLEGFSDHVAPADKASAG